MKADIQDLFVRAGIRELGFTTLRLLQSLEAWSCGEIKTKEMYEEYNKRKMKEGVKMYKGRRCDVQDDEVEDRNKEERKVVRIGNWRR
jgi:hypothetical protein